MPALYWLGAAFMAGGITGSYVTTKSSNLLGLAALGAGAYYLVKRG